ncbi:hypothetical protein EJ04DRAFT_96641 [Polyplosphaeria fusca]|uniref:Uncharacterized protein n=1 Tax=Polyplosphaeria fusca TaxID=682080 RepID=A0A9P4QJK0_9PLEO|nr:hypothetical protein EJ04DRAFT_96641 [Polyplosphaeria fusca]
MSFLRKYTFPNDIRWRRTSSPCTGPLALLPITILLILIWIFFASAQIYSRILWNNYERESALYDADIAAGRRGRPLPDYPPVLWGGQDGYQGISTFAFQAFLVLVPDTIHLPIHHFLFVRGKMHPVAALVLCICLGSLWFVSAFFTLFGQLFGEYYEVNAYDDLMITCAVLQLCLGITYWVYMGLAAAAVHKWRGKKRDGKAYGQGLRDGMELGGMGKRSGEAEV